MRMSIHTYTFKSIIFESFILKSVKMIQIIIYLEISENDTFESVKNASVGADEI